MVFLVPACTKRGESFLSKPQLRLNAGKLPDKGFGQRLLHIPSDSVLGVGEGFEIHIRPRWKNHEESIAAPVNSNDGLAQFILLSVIVRPLDLIVLAGLAWDTNRSQRAVRKRYPQLDSRISQESASGFANESEVPPPQSAQGRAQIVHATLQILAQKGCVIGAEIVPGTLAINIRGRLLQLANSLITDSLALCPVLFQCRGHGGSLHNNTVIVRRNGRNIVSQNGHGASRTVGVCRWFTLTPPWPTRRTSLEQTLQPIRLRGSGSLAVVGRTQPAAKPRYCHKGRSSLQQNSRRRRNSRSRRPR